MLNRRLEYQSQKAVLLHMDANVRFLISLHMPSIRSVEKQVPLRINRLGMDQCQARVNGTAYNLGVVRLDPEGASPKPLKYEWYHGGSPYDLDEFGFSVDAGAVFPGDVSFREEDPFENIRLEGDELEFSYKLKDYEKTLIICNELKSRGVYTSDYLRILEAVPDQQLTEEEREIRNALRTDSDVLPYRIEECKLELLPFECQENNTKPPFICYIQLNIMSEHGRYVKRFEYNKKLFEAAKHLNEVLFGGRTMPIQVGEFSLSHHVIYRLPDGFRLQVQRARFSHRTVIHKSCPLVVESLKTLEMNSKKFQLDDYKAQIVRNATRVVITAAKEQLHQSEPLVQAIRNLPNPEICILPEKSTGSPEFYFALIQAWLRGERQFGASLWMEIWGEKKANDVLALMRTQCEESRRAEICTTIDLSNTTELEPLCFPYRGKPCMLKINIVNV